MIQCMSMGCEREAVCRGMCQRHYLRWRRETPASSRPPVEPKPGKRHAKLTGLFGGIRPFCRAVGIDPNTLYRWPDGRIPEIRHEDILAGAMRAGVNYATVRAVLQGRM